MADARDFLVLTSSGPLIGGASGMSAIARDVTGNVRTAPAVTEVGEGVYRFTPTDDDETAGTVVCVDTGAGNEPRRVTVACFKPDRSNQFWAVAVEQTNGSVWAGPAPTVGSYRSSSGARTPPALVAVAAAWLFVAVPSAADVTADSEIRIDGPTGSAQPFWVAGVSPVVQGGAAPSPFLGPGLRIAPEAVAARALRDWLLATMPASCAVVNATRAATIKTPGLGPFTIPMAASLKLSFVGRGGAFTSINLTAGSRTSAQLAADINAGITGVASVDADGRLAIKSLTAPSFSALTSTNSAVVIGPDTTGANAALGFDAGGEYFFTTPVTPPGPKGVCDGMPTGGFFEPSQLGAGRVLVTIGERSSSPVDGNPRRYEWFVDLEVAVFRSEPQQVIHQTREGIQAALQVMRETLQTPAGQQLGRALNGDVQLCIETGVRISPWSFQQQKSGQQPGGLLFDAVNLKLRARVFQQPNL